MVLILDDDLESLLRVSTIVEYVDYRPRTADCAYAAVIADARTDVTRKRKARRRAFIE